MTTKTQIKMYPAASHEALLDFCNKVREAGGAQPLNALLPGIPSDAQSCLIAKNLNFRCSVGMIMTHEGKTPEDVTALNQMEEECNYAEGPWFMIFGTRKARDQVADKLGLKKVDANKRQWAMLLPAKIGNVAANFDMIGDEYITNFEEAYQEAIDGGMSKKDAAMKAAEVARKPFTRAMRRYADLTKVKDAP